MTKSNNNVKQQPLVGEVLPDETFLLNYKQLQVGQEFKNYKALCTFLGEPNKTGKSKQLQLKDWERYFSHDKNGNKFIITYIHSNPLDKVDNRKNNIFTVKGKKPSIFNEQAEITTSTMFLLAKTFRFTREHIDDKNYRRMAFKTTDFYREVGYCNSNYQTLVDLHGYYSHVFPKQISKFIFQDTNDKMRQFTKTALTQMKRQKLLDWSYSKAWIEHVYDEQGKVIDTMEHMATVEEKGHIMEAQNYAFNKWNETYPKKQLKNIYSIYNVLNRSERQEMFKWAKEYIKEFIPNYEYSYSTYEVMFIPQVIIRELKLRGFTDEELFDNSYMPISDSRDKSQIMTVNGKFVDYSINRLKSKFDTDMEAYNKWFYRPKPKGFVKGYQDIEPPYLIMEDKQDLDKGIEFINGALDKNRGMNQLVGECIHENVNRR